MKKNGVLYVIIIVLLIMLIVMTSLYMNMKKNAEKNFSEMLRIINEKYELEIEMNELQEKLDEYDNAKNN